MIGRKDFTTPEWQNIQTAIIESSRYIILAHSGFFEDLKESITAKQTIKNFANKTDSKFIKEIVDFTDYKSPIPKNIKNSSTALESIALKAISESVEIINKKDPSLATLFKNLITELTEEIINSNHKVSSSEAIAYQKIITALEAKPEPKSKKWDPSNPLAK